MTVLHEIPDEELERLIAVNTPILPDIEARTGIRRKEIMESLVQLDYLLRTIADGSEEDPLPLDAFIDVLCNRVAVETGQSVHDVRNIFIARTEVMLESHEQN